MKQIKQPLAAVFVMMIAAGFSASGQSRLVFIISMTVGCLLISIQLSRQHRFAALSLLLVFFAFFAYTDFSLKNASWYDAYVPDGTRVEVSGTVVSKTSSPTYSSLLLKDVTLHDGLHRYQSNQVFLTSYTQNAFQNNVQVGDEIFSSGTVSLFSGNRNPGNFNLKNYYRNMNIDFAIQCDAPERIVVSKHPKFSFIRSITDIRERMKEVLKTCLTDEVLGIATTMILADDSDLSPDSRMAFQTAGLSHLLCVSGLHISVTGALLYELLRRWKCPIEAAAVLSVIPACGFVLLSGAGLAAQRALIMQLLYFLSKILRRSYDPVSALSFAGIILLLMHPLSLYQTSFQLSFSASAGALILYPAVIDHTVFRRLQERKRWYRLLQSMLLCMSIQYATMPIVLNSYYELPLYGIAANLLILPWIGIIIISGLIGGLIGILTIPVAKIILTPAAVLLFMIHKFSILVQNLPHASLIAGKPERAVVVLAYPVMLVILDLILKRRKKNKHISCAIVLSLGLIAALLFHPINRSLIIDMIDVGQGECILIRIPQTSKTVMIDCGSTDVSNVGKYRILSECKRLGITQIDYLFFTHPDADHVNALSAFYENNYPPKMIILPKDCEKDSFRDLIALSSNQSQIRYISSQSDFKTGDVTFELLSPVPGASYANVNDASMVLLLTYGSFEALFTGDISSEVEEDLLHGMDDPDVDLLKIAHHGSKYASSDTFLDKVRPEAAIISAGVNNRYHHPSVEVLERLKNHGIMYMVTNQAGEIEVVVTSDGQMEVHGYLTEDML